jgi:hypothetical protein
MARHNELCNVNCVRCRVASRANDGQNLKISLLNSLLAGNFDLESGSHETPPTAIESLQSAHLLLSNASKLYASNRNSWMDRERPHFPRTEHIDTGLRQRSESGQPLFWVDSTMGMHSKEPPSCRSDFCGPQVQPRTTDQLHCDLLTSLQSAVR